MEDLMDIAYLAFVVALVIIVFHNQKKKDNGTTST